jgi:hypothetical protein
MADVMKRDPDLAVCYGKHHLTSPSGAILEQQSHRLNEAHFRTSRHEGVPQSVMWAALVQQVPGAGYLIKTELAQAVGFSSSPEIGDACDWEFWLRFAGRFPAAKLHYVDDYVYRYRQHEQNVSRTSPYTDKVFGMLSAIETPPVLRPLWRRRLEGLAPAAVQVSLRNGRTSEAWRIYSSEFYGWSRRLSPGGILLGLLILCPAKVLNVLLPLASHGRRAFSALAPARSRQ